MSLLHIRPLIVLLLPQTLLKTRNLDSSGNYYPVGFFDDDLKYLMGSIMSMKTFRLGMGEFSLQMKTV
jgi:hypothetical protein